MKLEVYRKSVYGRVMLYPANQAAAKIAELLGQATLTGKQLETVASIDGVTIEIVQDPDMV